MLGKKRTPLTCVVKLRSLGKTLASQNPLTGRMGAQLAQHMGSFGRLGRVFISQETERPAQSPETLARQCSAASRNLGLSLARSSACICYPIEAKRGGAG